MAHILIRVVFTALQDNLCQSILKSLALMDFEITEKAANKSAMPKAPIDGRLKAMSYRNSVGTGMDSSGVKGQLGDVMVEGLRTSIAARAALGTLLLVTHKCPSYLGRESWQVIWILLALLRDCSLLPGCMILVDTSTSGDTDLLPVAYRTEFEMRLLAADRKEVDAQLRLRNRLNPVSPYVKKSSSLLSLQGEILLSLSLSSSLLLSLSFSLTLSLYLSLSFSHCLSHTCTLTCPLLTCPTYLPLPLPIIFFFSLARSRRSSFRCWAGRLSSREPGSSVLHSPP